MRRVLVALVLVIVAIRCTVEPVDLAGKRCPCSDGWVCDNFTDTCKRSKAGDAALDHSQGGTGGSDGSQGGTGGGGEIVFGHACIGAIPSDPMGANRIRVSRYALLAPGTFSGLVIRIDGLGQTSGNQVVRGVIYDADPATQEPRTLVQSTEEVTIDAGEAAAWVDLPFKTALELDPAVYWLGAISGTQGGLARYTYDNSLAGTRLVDHPYADGPPTTFGTGEARDFLMSIHARPKSGSIALNDKCTDAGAGGNGGTTGGGGAGGTGGSSGGTGGKGGTGGTNSGGTGGIDAGIGGSGATDGASDSGSDAGKG